MLKELERVGSWRPFCVTHQSLSELLYHIQEECFSTELKQWQRIYLKKSAKETQEIQTKRSRFNIPEVQILKSIYQTLLQYFDDLLTSDTIVDFRIHKYDISPRAAKVRAISELPELRNDKEAKASLGHFGFFRRPIEN
ncbi:hypothetical protein ACTFIW_008723 [Dictyostelium discoideum]